MNQTTQPDDRVTMGKSATPDARDQCVVYRMQRARRGGDDPVPDRAIGVAIALNQTP
jgi:hypothetical protein